MNTSAFSRASLALAFLASSISLAIPISSSALASQGYYRSPALQGNTVVFTAEGDIWRTSTAGGTAQRLTSHPALESQGLLSPDGQQLAFVADYEGAEEIYLLPLSGGTATRLTFEHSRVRLQQFLADGRILYSTDSAVGPANHWLLKLVDTNSLQSETLPLADASAGVIDTATNMLYFTRFGLQLTGDNAKVYRGGAMGQLWRWRLGSTEEAVRLLPEHQGSISQPQFDNGRLYFVSDADGNTNIWSLTAKGADLTQHSQHQDWRIGRISVQQGRAIYQLGADIYQLELATATSAPLAISLMSDFVQRRERWLDKPLNFLTFSALSPNSKTVALTARSQIALAGTGQQRLVQIATAEGSRSRQAILSPDGKAVYAINDASGENEIWRFAADGSNKAEQLTRDGKVFRWGLHLSPDGRFIAHDDKNGDLWLLDLSSGQNRLIYQQGWGHSAYQEVVWSADSQLLAFTLQHQQRPLRQLVLFSLAENRSELLTSDKYESFSPTFSHDGLWLYFLSNRQFNATPGSPWGDRNLGPMFDKRAEIFAISLKQQACFAFQAIQEVNTCDNAAAKAAQSGRRASLVDWDGLAGRLWQVPVAAGNYQQLAAHEQHLYLLARAAGEQKAELKFIKLTAEDIKLQLLTTDVADYQLAANGKTLFIRKHATSGSGEMLLIDAADKMPANLALAKLNTAGWQLLVKPMQEWQQMFRDAWLMHRDFLFDKNMRGLDWQQSRDKYQPLLARLTDRHELDDIFAQMMGELNALHSQVRGGEYAQDPNSAKAASLGAQLQQTANGVRISHIYRGDPELPSQASPLARAGVNAQQNDIITAINGQPVTQLADVSRLLRNQAAKPVLLTLSRGRQKLQTVVQPVTTQQDHLLRYRDWVQHNQQLVATNGNQRIGYLHLYAMGANDIASFAREFYAQYQKDGLIIDVRRNRGGNIDSWIIEKLLRRAWSFWQPTHGAPYSNMQQAFRGHLVVLTDELTYSDGETFSAGVKALGLGPLIGQRTAGAGVWLSGRNQLADNGLARVAETPQFAMDGRNIIEGYGVTPDIAVENLPYVSFNGQDAQLARALQYLQQQLQQSPIAPMRAEPIPKGPAADISLR